MKKGQKTGTFDAFSLFPDLMRKVGGEVQPKNDAVQPPLPPDVGWLSKGLLDDKDGITDVPGALVLMTDGGAKQSVALTLKKAGYRVEYSQTTDDALRKLSSIAYAVVVLHTGFERGGSPTKSIIHNYLAKLPMTRRRLLYYILLGPDFKTLYNLEALALSANLVVNEADVEQLPKILKKSIRDYNELFGPLIESLETYR